MCWACRSRITSDVVTPGRRLAAFCVDSALALVVTGLLITPILTLADPSFWSQSNPIPLIWGLVMAFLGILNRGTTPGKRWLGLRVTGDGCIICREIRRLWVVLAAGLAALFMLITPGFALLAIVAWLGGLWLEQVVMQRADYRHNTATGFEVISAR